MMKRKFIAVVFALGALASSAGQAEELVWGVKVEQLEVRTGDNGTDVLAWDGDAVVGTDELKFVVRNEGEFETDGDALETMETQARLQMPISDFFDVAAGIRFDTPEGPNRVHGVVGIKGLAPQWFELDADLYMSDHPSFRFNAEYEALITNRLILTPSIEIDLPFNDDREIEIGAWGPKTEIGMRLSYDLVDRSFAPYVGVHYERYYGETKDIKIAEGKEGDALWFVTGVRLQF
ncbi:copper resistance protein B [Thalassospiraceae bacterium LMO-JJ14]|nr:copper resistance protein B [Thalassospiraceae bacterium LMO-JJ14]